MIDEAILLLKNNEYLTNREEEQIAEWLEELKAYRTLDKTNFSDGYNAGYSKAENDYYAQSEKDRQSSYDCGYEIGYNKAIDEETINQIEFIKILANRLDANECPTRIKADAIRLRRELNTLSKMQDWDSRWNRMKEKCDK